MIVADSAPDDNASNPHGGTNGSKILEAATFVLIDVGYAMADIPCFHVTFS
jgi:hypothetical protein